MAWQDRRYSPWLLEREERLQRRQRGLDQLVIFAAVAVALAEGLMPWESFTPDIHPGIHIGAAAVILPVLYFMHQADFRRKVQAFTLAMSERGKRLLFLDPYLEAEEFERQEQFHGAAVLPLQRSLDNMLKLGACKSLNERVDLYFRIFPSPMYEEDRTGWLSILHPKTFIGLVFSVAFIWAALPGVGIEFGPNRGLSMLPLLLLLYLISARANTRFAFEEALYNWLRLG